MRNRYITEECNKILNFWKLEEYFTPSDYPELTLTIKEGKQDIPFDAYYNAYSTRSLPLKEYKAHNEYLIQKHKSDEKLYNRANVYCGCYKIKTFVEKMAEKCKLDMEKYAEINELSGRFYIFSVQIDLDGKLTEESVQISPFFYAVLCMIKSEGINVNIMQEDICKLNEDVNELLKQNDIQILEFTDITIVKNIVFDKLGVENESQVGLEGASDKVYACKGLKKEDETSDFFSFYLDEIERVQKNYKNNEHVIKYITSLLYDNQKKIMIDSDVNAMKKWLEVDRFPLAKYPSKFSPTLMQQLAINIAISEKDRYEKIFSVNGPPGTGKTTLLKEIIASNVEQLAEVLIKYGIDGGNFVSRKIESASNASYTEKYYEIPEEIAKFGILVVSNNNGAVENVTLDLPKSGDMEKEKTRTDYFDRKINREVYFSVVADNLLGEEGSAWGLISARMGRKSYVSLTKRNTEEVCGKIENQYSIISTLEKKVQILEEKVYGNNESLKNKYKNNFADRYFYENIKESENSQNACPWTFDEYDMAREELFYASLQVRKAFILNSPYIKRNLFVYQAYNNGKYTIAEKQEMFPHLFNSLSVVIPVLSSTFASVGRFLKHAGNMSLGMLIIDESGQAMPQSALGALYRTRQAVVVGDPLQVEPVVTIPKVLIDILADSTGVANEYKVIENSVQTFADNMNEFNGMIGERQVGCPLVVHRRCIEPMFSISNMISYDNRMFNKTNKKEDYLKQEQPFLIKKSGWINVEGTENGSKDHFVKNQAERVCQLLESALHIYTDLFDTDDKVFIITPFRTVAESMRKFVVGYFSAKGNDKEVLKKWTKKCVGTVHTFQGKDANEVIFVLGCSDKSVGAMNWVVKKANILNVACTRAKYRIAFIGNLNDWKNRRYFREFIPKFIDTIDV